MTWSQLSCLVVACAIATPAQAKPVERVVVADPDPELRRAVTSALAPWHIEVVLETAPSDDAEARRRAEATHARFVIWRDRGELVVYDRERGTAERRGAEMTAFDPVGAAAAALTVKTMMRLPAPDDAPADERDGPQLRAQLVGGARIEAGASTSGRLEGDVLVLPWPTRGWRFGAAGDLNTSGAIDTMAFKGTWREWSVLALASWTQVVGPCELEPWLAAGVARSTVAGMEMKTMRDERATLLAIHGGAWARWRFGAASVGLAVGVDTLPGAPTYTKTMPAMKAPTIFEVPAIAVVLGLLVAIDLGR